MENSKNKVTLVISTIKFSSILTLILIILKLIGVLGWSWIWVLSPLWIPTAISMALIIVLSFIAGLVMIFTSLYKE